ncbi:MAG: class I adenylate-forming enzyme family protein [Alphaproteobacteria bacterium]
MTIPELERISDYPRHYAQLLPEREALVLGDWRLSYRAFADAVDRCAKALLASGVGKGDRVAMLSTPRPEYFIVFLATARIGGIWLGLNPRYRLDEYRYVVGDAKPKLLFAITAFEDRDYLPDLGALMDEYDHLERVVTLGHSVEGLSVGCDEFLAAADQIPEDTFAAVRDAVSAKDPALIVYTSGTTGKPKGAMLPHRGLVHCSRIQCEHWRTEPMRILNNLPINHIACVGDISSYSLVAGGTIVFMERFDPEGILALIARERLTAWGQVPTMFQLTVALPNFDDYDLSSLRAVVWGGAAAPRALILKLKKLGVGLYSSYGLTESVGSVTYTDEDASIDVLADTVGRPDPRYEVRIAGPDGKPVARGEPGEIQVRGDFITLGYVNRPEATAEAIDADGWLHTGDVAVEREDGNYKLAGRLKEVYKSGGYNVYPREIETIIESHPAVAMAAVIGVPDPIYGEVGHAFILNEPGAALSEPEIAAYCGERLANYKVPKEFVVRTELPMLTTGKIDKTALKAEAEAASAGA